MEALDTARDTAPDTAAPPSDPSREDILRWRRKGDERLTPLLHRWPTLSELELRELRRVYAERQRLARHLGRLRRVTTT